MGLIGNERESKQVVHPDSALKVLFLPNGPDVFFLHLMGDICSTVLCLPEDGGLDSVSWLDPHLFGAPSVPLDGKPTEYSKSYTREFNERFGLSQWDSSVESYWLSIIPPCVRFIQSRCWDMHKANQWEEMCERLQKSGREGWKCPFILQMDMVVVHRLTFVMDWGVWGEDRRPIRNGSGPAPVFWVCCWQVRNEAFTI